jgi:endo-1,4-beta-xylanase
MSAVYDLSLPSLCKTFGKHFKIGNILSPNDFDDETLEMYKYHYNAVTAENVMKPEYVTTAAGVFDFGRADKIVDWAEENGIAIVGHTFIWHAQTPLWLNRNADGTPLTRREARANMEELIKAYAERYSGRIHSWDVINEAFTDTESATPYSGNWRDYLRRESENPRAEGHWFLAYANGDGNGADYIFDAYYYARKYDPEAILYYNEYNEEFRHKRLAIADMVNEINGQWRNHREYDNRLLIEGIGMQSHHNHEHSDIKKVRAAFELFIKTGAVISITEMDFTFGTADEPSVPLTAEQTRKQAEMYAELFKVYLEYSKYIERVTFWGKNDKQSWRAWGSPLLFDRECQAKEAFYALSDLKNKPVASS